MKLPIFVSPDSQAQDLQYIRTDSQYQDGFSDWEILRIFNTSAQILKLFVQTIRNFIHRT